ncbi:MAG: hypothetical protein D3905_08165 [Candidatus Electrothrix sp. AS4_5]|nr:hypothetical protein [Candidatus Electrothrix gigas]
MKLHDIRKRELLKEKGRLKEAKSLQTSKKYVDATRRNVESQRGKTNEHIYFGQVEWYKEILNVYKTEKNRYKKKYKFFPEKHWHIKQLEIFNYNFLIKEITSFLLPSRLSDNIAVLFTPSIDKKYKIYISFVNKKDEIITEKDKEFGRLIIANRINSELKEIIINNNLILFFNIRNGNIELNETSHVHLDAEFYPEWIESYQENIQKSNQHKSIIVPFQMISILSGIIVFILIVIENYFNITISKHWILGIGIGFPAAGVSFFDLLQDKIPILSENLQYAGKALIGFGCIVLLLTFFSKVTPFLKPINIILNVVWPIATGIWMVEISSEKVPKRIVSSTTDRFCDECIGREKIETDSFINNCSKCSGTGLYGEYIEKLLRIKDIVSRRRSVVISALLYPVVLSLLFVIFR